MSKRKDLILEKAGIKPKRDKLYNSSKDIKFISEVGPQGGISFEHEKFTLTGRGYEACIYVYGYPHEVDYHWLYYLSNIKDTIFVLDIASIDKTAIKKNLNRAMEEHLARKNTAKTVSEAINANKLFQESTELYAEIAEYGAIMKTIIARIYVPAFTLAECDKRVSEIIEDLSGKGFKATVCINETKSDYRNTFLSFSQQKRTMYARQGQGMLSSTLALGNPFHFTKLSDPQGAFYGTTETGGSVIFDLFRITQLRNSYDGIIVGVKGSGKSTLLKKTLLDRIARGDKVRVFDAADDFLELSNVLYGKTIDLSGGTGGIINALQILNIGENDRISYINHIAKVATIYKYLKPEAKTEEVLVLKRLLRLLYIDYGIIDNSGKFVKPLSSYKPKDFPIWSDFLNLINKEMVKSYLASNIEKSDGEYDSVTGEITEEEFFNKDALLNHITDYIASISLQIEDMCTSYGDIFNQHTNIEDFSSEQLVRFDIKNLINFESNVFDAQIFQALSLCWAACCEDGKKMKDLWDKREIDWRDIKRSVILIDEAHRVVSAKKLAGIDQLLLFSREGRKYFISLILATQSIRDFVPDDATGLAVEQIKTLFELATYKWVMRQDANCQQKLLDIFSGIFTASQVSNVHQLEQGEALLSVGGEESIKFHVDCSDDELRIFSGGA